MPKSIFNTVILLFILASCRHLDVYEKNLPVPGYTWNAGFAPEFVFEITDTASPYTIYAVLRHTSAYRYNNIWLRVGTAFPGDSMRYERIELRLGSDAGGWEGNGMDDIWEVRKPLTTGPVRFGKKGRYRFSLAQIMRDENLPSVMSAGIRVEKAKP